jgi:hypothetical protein
MKYKATVYAAYVGEVDAPNEASAKLQAECDMIVEMQEFYHPKVKILVKLEPRGQEDDYAT